MHQAISRGGCALALSFSFFLIGCAPAFPATHTEEAIGRAAGVRDAIVFKTDAEAIDASEPFGKTLKLADAIRQALDHDPSIQSALARVRAAEAEAGQARLLPNPILSVSVRAAFEGKTAIEAGLSEDLVALLTRPGRISAADSRLRSASAGAVSAALDVVAAVQQQYAAVQALDALMPVLEERRSLLARLLALAESRLQRGEGTRLDVTTLNAQRADMEVEIKEQQLERRQERLGLARLIGQPSGDADWSVTPWQPPPQTSGAEAAWIELALANRPEVQARRFELAALGQEVRLSPLGIFEGNGLGVESQKDPDWQVGPALTTPVPIFDWGQARKKKAVAALIQAGHDLTQARRQIVEEVRKAYEGFISTQQTLQTVCDELLPLQEQRREQAEAAYRAGQTDVTALILAEQDLQSARTRLVGLQRKTSASLIGLQRAVGGPGPLNGLSPAAAATQPAGTLPTKPTTTTPSAD